MGENTANGIEALEFESGEQWPADLKKARTLSGRPSLTVNRTRTMVRRVVNNMRQQRPRIKVHPVGDGADIDKAEKISGIIRHIENLSHASTAYDGAGESAVKIGWGYARILGEYCDERSREQELKIHSIRNPFTCYDDPSCQLPTGQDRDFFLITIQMSRSDYKRQYPKAENANWQHGGPGDEGRDWESPEKVRLAEYYRVHKTQEKLYTMTDGSGLFESELMRMGSSLASSGVQVKQGPDGKPLTRMSQRREIQWFQLNGRKVIQKRSLPGKWIPVSRCLGNLLDLNGKVLLTGMVKDLMDANRMYNYWRSCETELVALAPRAPWLVAEGQTDGHPEWNDANQKPYSKLVWKPVHSDPDDPTSPILPPPSRVEPPAIPQAVVGAAQGAEHDMMALAGMEHEPAQDKPGEVISGVALRRRQAMSDIGHFQYYDNQTMFIAHLGEIIVDLIPYYYSEDRMQRIVGEDGVPQMVGINQRDPVLGEIKNDLTIGRYDVVMDTGPGYETKRQEGAETMIDLIAIPEIGAKIANVGSDLVVRAIDAPYMGELADRLAVTTPDGMKKAMENLPKQAQAIVNSMQQQMQQLQQQLQHAQLELKYKGSIEQGWMSVERDRTAKQEEGKLHKTSIDAQVKTFDTHVKSVTARDVAEINAGAKLIDSNQDRAHEKELVDITAAAAKRAETKAE